MVLIPYFFLLSILVIVKFKLFSYFLGLAMENWKADKKEGSIKYRGTQSLEKHKFREKKKKKLFI